MNDFTELLNRVAKDFPSRHALAKALKINASRLSRALNGTDPHPFNIENCLGLAKVSGVSASEVLRAANKGKVAELIESLYGPEKNVTDPAVQDLLSTWAAFTADEKHYVRISIAMALRSHRHGETAPAKRTSATRIAKRG